MSQSILSRRTVFGISTALLILLIFFFILPSAFRGARLAVANKKNNIKDWLPSDFRETVELEWFAKYFMGESFVLATWDGCTMSDQRLELFAAKLRHESAQRQVPDSPDHLRARELAEELQLFIEPPSTQNWGGLNEKWFASPSGQFYYITPDGRFYRWEEGSNAVGGGIRAIRRALGRYQLEGQFIAAFGDEAAGGVNEFYNDPALLAASLFQTVETGGDMVERLAAEGGPLWPIDLTDVTKRPAVAKQRAIERLTGTLFAPAVPYGFGWTPAEVYEQLPEATRAQLPEDYEALIPTIVERLETQLGVPLDRSTTEQQGVAWDALCSALGVETPPRQTCLLVTLTPLGKDHLARAVGRGVVGGPRGRLLILGDESGLSAAQPPSMAPPPFDRNEDPLIAAGGRALLRTGGPPIDNVAIDEEGTVTLIRLVGYSGLVGLFVAFICFRSVNLTIMIFLVGLTAAVLGLALTYWTGGIVDAILMTMPSLLYVLGLSGAIHIVNYYRDEVREQGIDGAAGRALRHAIVPCSLAVLTTALGLISLSTSNILPIYNFGIYTAASVVATLIILFTYLPSALETFPPSFALRMSGRSDSAAEAPAAASSGDGDGETELSTFMSDLWAGFGRWVTRHHIAVSIAGAVIFVIGLFGIPKIETSVHLLKMFDSESRIIDDYAYLETNFGKLVPMEVVIRVPPAMIANHQAGDEPLQAAAAHPELPTPMHPLNVLQRAEAIQRIDAAVERTLGEVGTGVIGQTMSAATFFPPLPEPSNSYSPIRARYEAELRASLGELQTSDYYRVERNGPYEGSELWRLSLRVGALSDVDYGQFVGDLRKTVTPVLEAYRARELILTGLDQAAAATADDAPAGNRRSSPRVLLIGSQTPKPIAEAEFLQINDPATRQQEIERAVHEGLQGELIRSDQLYLSTLGELLRGERMQRPIWIDFDSESNQVQPGGPRWQQLVEMFDLLVLVGDQQAVARELLEQSGRPFLDLRPQRLPETEPLLLADIPTEVNAGPLQAVYSGIVPVVYKAQRTLLESLIESTVLAFFLIAFVMVLLLIPGRFPRSYLNPRGLGIGIVAGFTSMLPNLFPAVVIFGLMGHAGILVDIGTMMTASVAMGVAVDDTIHFLTWFRQYLDRGYSRIEAIIETYRRVGPAMTQTTMVGGLGLYVFSLSTFTPTQRFGTLMLVLLVTAMIGDLFLFPAMLAGPLGRWFRPRTPAPDNGSPTSSPPSPAQDDGHAPQPADRGQDVLAAASRNGDDGEAVIASGAHRPPPTPKGSRQGGGSRQPASGEPGYAADGPGPPGTSLN